MKWQITHDYIDTSGEGTTSPYGAPDESKRIAFKMLDSDDILYYRGYCEEESFDPLDDFGLPNAGCTDIQYRQPDGTWEIL